MYSSVEDIEKVGGKGLPCIADIRFKDQVEKAVEDTIDEFGGIDILVNDASAINLSSTLNTSMKRFDLMFSVNVRGTFLCSKVCIPYLKKAENPHILNMSPPLNLDPKWFANHVAYTMSKYGMSMCVLGMSEEFKKDGIAVNALWPRTAIATAAVKNLLGGETSIKHSRKPEIVADAAFFILTSPSKECTGNFFIDDEVLIENGISNLEKYSVVPGAKLIQDFFLYGGGET
ncbi:MAG: Short chain dehydrogenase [Promethearchaeota archaeon]|nr:MAG: Short chain dehydrogenase [Candidatus Lokiarchaeota archaeon]